jgi:predicted GIY-YIG superfamily endonuclease
LLQSESAIGQRYVGVTADLRQRLAEHNAGKSAHTSKYVPWKLVTYVAFSDERKAEAFERYLKSGSGHAFARKRFW